MHLAAQSSSRAALFLHRLNSVGFSVMRILGEYGGDKRPVLRIVPLLSLSPPLSLSLPLVRSEQ